MGPGDLPVDHGIKGTSIMKLHRDLGVAQSTAWHLAHRVRASWQRSLAPFAGPVEADETFVGGKEHNKLRAGHGNIGMIPIADIKDWATNEVRAQVVGNVDTATLQDFVNANLDEEAELFTDENSAYVGMRRHTAIKHCAGEYVDGTAHTPGIESFWANLKRSLVGTYYKVSLKHLPGYVNEFEGRHDSRNVDTLAQMDYMERGMVGQRLTLEELTSEEEE